RRGGGAAPVARRRASVRDLRERRHGHDRRDRRPPGQMTGIHPAARVGFGQAAAAYERGRPEYPAEAIEWLVRELGVASGTRVLDLAAGTGKLTRTFVPTGAWLVAVEPVEGMRREFRSILPTVAVVGG